MQREIRLFSPLQDLGREIPGRERKENGYQCVNMGRISGWDIWSAYDGLYSPSHCTMAHYTALWQ